MKRRYANLSFALKITLLGLLILLGRFGRETSQKYVYYKQPVQATVDTSHSSFEGQQLFFENVTWQQKK